MRGTTFMVLLAGVALAGTVQAANAAGKTAKPTTGYVNGVQVAIDPVTGRLRQPTAAQIRALRASVSQRTAKTGKPMPKTRADAQRTVRKLRDGSVIAEVSEDMLSTMVAVRQPDGSVRVQHAGDADVQEAGNE